MVLFYKLDHICETYTLDHRYSIIKINSVPNSRSQQWI